MIVLSYLSEFWQGFVKKFIETVQVGDIRAEINDAIIPKTVFSIKLGGISLPVSDAVVATWAVMVVLFFLGWIFGRKLERVPNSKRQMLSETLISILLKLCQTSNMNYEQAERIVPYVGTIALFISFSNLSSMFKIPPPAKNPAFPIALALFTIFYVIGASIRLVGLRGFWHSLIYPKAALLPFKILDYMIKPMSLSLRLFGNVFGAFILMEFVYIVVPAFLPGIIGLWFDLADGLLQGVIFTYLSVTYIGEVLEGAHLASEAAHISAHT